MSNAIGKLAVILTGDASGLNKTLAKAKSDVQSASQQFIKGSKGGSEGLTSAQIGKSDNMFALLGAASKGGGVDLKKTFTDSFGPNTKAGGVDFKKGGGLIDGLGSLAGALGKVAGPIAMVAGGVGASVKTFQMADGAVDHFVSKSNPMLSKLNRRASDDLEAAIGQHLEGASALFTMVDRTFADQLVSMKQGKAYTPGISVGAAVRPAQFSSPENLTRQAVLDSYAQAQADNRPPEASFGDQAAAAFAQPDIGDMLLTALAPGLGRLPSLGKQMLIRAGF